MTAVRSPALLTAADVYARLTDGGEIAVLDIREGDDYARGHLSVAVPIADSELELRVTTRVPRRSVRVLVVGRDNEQALDAATRLTDLGYTDVDILDGGVDAWAAAGRELITGLNSLSKALGEFVERHYHTPKITVDELKQQLDAGDDVVVLDTRPLPEYHSISIPTGEPAPGAELLYRVFDRVPSPTTRIVVNCAGRTRAIIGAQALINAGLPNPVVSLENGTSAWLFAGYQPGAGAAELLDDPSVAGLDRARAAADRIRERFGIAVLDAAEVTTLRAESDIRTVYLIDIRTVPEFEAGHLPGAVPVPGGQLVQATDLHIGTRHARIVLVDGPDLVRSSITASWLLQLGLDQVSVYAAGPDALTESGPPAQPALVPADAVATVAPAALDASLRAGEAVTVVDLQREPLYFETRRFVPGSVAARRSTLRAEPETLSAALTSGTVVLVSLDGRLAESTAAELTARTGHTVAALAGGVLGWQAAGLPVEEGIGQPSLTPGDSLLPAPDLEARKVSFAEYVAWGDTIVEQLERDGIVRFRAFPEVSSR